MEDFSPHDWKVLFSYTQIVDFTIGQILITQGRRERSVYILLSGEVCILTLHNFLNQKMLATLSEGNIFGEIAFFNRKPRQVTIQSTTTGQCLRISFENYVKLSEDHPDIARKFIMNLAMLLAHRNAYSGNNPHNLLSA